MSTVEIFKEFDFEAAHRLPHVSADHPCGRIHGHSYRVTIHVAGPIDPRLGWVVDFATIKDAIKPLRSRLDHHLLNEVDGLDNPTSENLARWFWSHLKPSLPLISQVVVRETRTSGCIYRGED
ncbi:MAG: 6-carboxytetrahydropterin synthase QueD [Deltaproteobacteria bacterium]|nr:6-carboxytetrahydropterin synthase QueD [Deltaproteobacteria bacterium]